MTTPGGIRIETLPSNDDIAAWDMRRQRLDHPLLYWTRTLFPIALYCLAVVHYVLTDGIRESLVVTGCGVAATWVSIVLMPRYRQRRWAAQLGAQPSDGFVVTTDELGVREEGSRQSRLIPWSSVTSIETTRGMVTIEAPPSAPVMLPLRAFPNRAVLREFAARLRQLRAAALPGSSFAPPADAIRIDLVDPAEQAAQIAGRSLAEGAQFTRMAMAAACLVGLWLSWPWGQSLLAMFWGIILCTMLMHTALQSPLARRWEQRVLEVHGARGANRDEPSYLWFEEDSVLLAHAGRLDRSAISAIGAIVASPTMVTFFTSPTAAISVPVASFESVAEFEQFVGDLQARKEAAAKAARAA